MKQQTELIRFHEVTCHRPPNAPVTHVNLVICHGEVVGFIAPDDTAKQMLLDLLIGHLAPSDGLVLSPYDRTAPFFGYCVNGEKFFDEQTVADNLLWISNTRRQLILSRVRTNARAQALLDLYDLPFSPEAKLRSLSRFERYQLDIVKAIEIFHVKLLLIDRIHTIESEQEQQQLLAQTSAFREGGGAVAIVSILRLNVFQQAAKTYLLQGGQPIRTLFNNAQNLYRAHTDMLFSDFMHHSVSALLPHTSARSSQPHFSLHFDLEGHRSTLHTYPGEVLCLHDVLAVDDRYIDRLLSTGQLVLQYNGRPLRITGLADLVGKDVGYFPKQVEHIMFYRLTLRDNVETFAYPNLCSIPGIISRRLEAYFMEHCVTADDATANASDLSQIRHSTMLQTAINRYLQRPWKMMLLHIPTFMCNTLEYHLVQNFIATLCNKGTAVVLLSNEVQSLSPFSLRITELRG